MHSVLVLDQVAQTLAVVRALGHAGYRVILGRGHAPGEAERSRHCAQVWHHPPIEDPSFESALTGFLDARKDIRAIFPVGEGSAAAVGSMSSIDARIGVACVPHALLEACRDKRAAHSLAVVAGLRTPETRWIREVGGLCSFVSDVGYPVIVKPIRSTTKLLGRKAYILRNDGEHQARFAVWPAGHDELLVQRYIVGPLEQCDFVAVDGEVICFFQAHTTRTDRPDGTGFGVDFLSDPIDAGVLEACCKFARAHRYTGPGLLQLVHNIDDAQLYFIENNPRLAAGVAQAEKCGVNMPRLLVEVALRNATSTWPTIASTATTPYEVGQRTHWLSRDLNGYFEMRHELSAAERGRWRRAMVHSLLRAQAHMTWDADDPAPSFLIYRRLFRGLLSRGARAA